MLPWRGLSVCHKLIVTAGSEKAKMEIGQKPETEQLLLDVTSSTIDT